MGKKIWIFNHYATNMFFEQGGRHYWFAKYLLRAGYEVKIFCANTVHNSDLIVDTKDKLYIEKTINEVPFVFVKTRAYKGNGKKRILNVFDFYFNLFKVYKDIADKDGLPDILYASSVHPLTLVAGIKIAKRFSIPCICEVRDLWPESIVAYKIAKKKNPIIQMMYYMEKWIYERANAIIFTMEGGKEYVIEKGWNFESGGKVELKKIFYINNGVDLEQFNVNREKEKVIIPELYDEKVFKVLYTGSVRKANQVELLIETGTILQNRGKKDIGIFIFGEGEERKRLEEKCHSEKIDNVKFYGHVPKDKIPAILSLGDLNIIVAQPNELYRFGLSLNKMFEYFAAEKPTLSTLRSKYDIINKAHCGKTIQSANPESIADCIEYFYNLSDGEYKLYCENALEMARKYDFACLTEKLSFICDKLIEENR